jgi:hypothetical protein
MAGSAGGRLSPAAKEIWGQLVVKILRLIPASEEASRLFFRTFEVHAVIEAVAQEVRSAIIKQPHLRIIKKLRWL